jgi:hypothetical protein
VSFAAITLYVDSQRVFIVVSVYFVIDSVRKLFGYNLVPMFSSHASLKECSLYILAGLVIFSLFLDAKALFP